MGGGPSRRRRRRSNGPHRSSRPSRRHSFVAARSRRHGSWRNRTTGSDERWEDAGRPRASVALSRGRPTCSSRCTSSRPLRSSCRRAPSTRTTTNTPDINGHGVQLYVRTPVDGGAWIVIPGNRPNQRARAATPRLGLTPLTEAGGRATTMVFEVRARSSTPARAAGNAHSRSTCSSTTPSPGRERRRGQLVLSGAAGEFVYFRGDRHDPERLVPVVVVPES